MTTNGAGTATRRDRLYDQRAALYQNVLDTLGPEVLSEPRLPEIMNRMIDARLGLGKAPSTNALAADAGIAELIGIGPSAVTDLGQAQMSEGVVDYDDTLVPARIIATADLYYLYV